MNISSCYCACNMRNPHSLSIYQFNVLAFRIRLLSYDIDFVLFVLFDTFDFLSTLHLSSSTRLPKSTSSAPSLRYPSGFVPDLLYVGRSKETETQFIIRWIYIVFSVQFSLMTFNNELISTRKSRRKHIAKGSLFASNQVFARSLWSDTVGMLWKLCHFHIIQVFEFIFLSISIIPLTWIHFHFHCLCLSKHKDSTVAALLLVSRFSNSGSLQSLCALCVCVCGVILCCYHYTLPHIQPPHLKHINFIRYCFTPLLYTCFYSIETFGVCQLWAKWRINQIPPELKWLSLERK